MECAIKLVISLKGNVQTGSTLCGSTSLHMGAPGSIISCCLAFAQLLGSTRPLGTARTNYSRGGLGLNMRL